MAKLIVQPQLAFSLESKLSNCFVTFCVFVFVFETVGLMKRSISWAFTTRKMSITVQVEIEVLFSCYCGAHCLITCRFPSAYKLVRCAKQLAWSGKKFMKSPLWKISLNRYSKTLWNRIQGKGEPWLKCVAIITSCCFFSHFYRQHNNNSNNNDDDDDIGDDNDDDNDDDDNNDD